jgi:2-polyprenyl-3-methyl-5-hydroxy-6-metoxy-1,4-benzoquinol methylase
LTSPDLPPEAALNETNREAWRQNASFWHEHMQAGNDYHRLLLRPAFERLLQLHHGERVLDAACGDGQHSRWLATEGARVTAFDFSPELVRLAERASLASGIDFRIADATNKSQLLELADGHSFDAILCSNALMDMPVIEPLIEAAHELLKPNGRFVFSVVHPCFNTSGAAQVVEQWSDDDGTDRLRFAVKVWRYKTAATVKGNGIQGQPAPQIYFDRPLEDLLSAFFEHGFAMDGIVEPAFAPEDRPATPSWRNMTDLPPFLVARMRPR